MLVNSDIFLLLYVVRWQSGPLGVDDIYMWTHIIANCNCCCMDLTSLCLKRFDTDDHRDICDTVPAKTRIVMMFLLVLLMIIFVEKNMK